MKSQPCLAKKVIFINSADEEKNTKSSDLQ